MTALKKIHHGVSQVISEVVNQVDVKILDGIWHQLDSKEEFNLLIDSPDISYIKGYFIVSGFYFVMENLEDNGGKSIEIIHEKEWDERMKILSHLISSSKNQKMYAKQDYSDYISDG